MELNKMHLVCFSPTHTSKQVAKAIVHGTGAQQVVDMDVTLFSPEEITIPETEMALFAVPVYGGRVAPLALERMANIRGNDTPAILVVVYGNRAYEKALMELDAFVLKRGFKVIAAGTFIGEHSYSSEKYPIAVGRPNKDDLLVAEDFGKQVMDKVNAASDPEGLYAVDVRTIKRPSQPFFSLLRFLRQIIKMRKSGVPSPKAPSTNAEACIHCGICVENCPNDAIIIGEEQHTIVERCIRCCACIKLCPQHARSFETPYAPLLSAYFPKQKDPKVLV